MTLRGIRAVGVVVASLENCMADYSRIVGVPSWSVRRHEERRSYVNGRQRTVAYDLARGELSPGVFIELIRPSHDGSTFQQHLMEHGEGVHYLEIDGTRAGLIALHQRLTDGGAAVTQRIGSQSWYDTRAELGGWHVKLGPRPTGPEPEPAPLVRDGEPWMRARHLVHLGVVVDDVFREARAFAEILGVGDWSLDHWRTGEGSLNDPVFRGRPVNHEYLSATAALGGTGFELVQPTQGPSHYADFRERTGAGIHHFYLAETGDGRDEWGRLHESMADFGLSVAMGSSLLDDVADFAYVETAARLGGLTVEIAAMRPGRTFADFIPTCSLNLHARVNEGTAR